MSTFETENDKNDFIIKMRKIFTHKSMLNDDLSLNIEAFRPKISNMQEEIRKKKKWGPLDTENLFLAIEECGIGNWNEMQEKYSLAKWPGNELSKRTKNIIGSQSLARYRNWKGNKEQCALEFKENKRIGELLNCWKGGVLVNDDQGKLEEYFSNIKSNKKKHHIDQDETTSSSKKKAPKQKLKKQK